MQPALCATSTIGPVHVSDDVLQCLDALVETRVEPASRFDATHLGQLRCEQRLPVLVDVAA